MLVNQEWLHCLQQINGQLNYQNEQMKQLSDSIQNLVQEVNQLKEKTNQPQVVNNDYKFDLLKVETLSGSLSIGIKPDGTQSSIEEMSIDQAMDIQSVDEEFPELYNNVQRQVMEYFDQQFYKTMHDYENRHGFILGDSYRKFIADDVKKQIDGRIRFYINKLKPGQRKADASLERQIVLKITKDIERTVDTFIKNLPKGKVE